MTANLARPSWSLAGEVVLRAADGCAAAARRLGESGQRVVDRGGATGAPRAVGASRAVASDEPHGIEARGMGSHAAALPPAAAHLLRGREGSAHVALR